MGCFSLQPFNLGQGSWPHTISQHFARDLQCTGTMEEWAIHRAGGTWSYVGRFVWKGDDLGRCLKKRLKVVVYFILPCIMLLYFIFLHVLPLGAQNWFHNIAMKVWKLLFFTVTRNQMCFPFVKTDGLRFLSYGFSKTLLERVTRSTGAPAIWIPTSGRVTRVVDETCGGWPFYHKELRG